MDVCKWEKIKWFSGIWLQKSTKYTLPTFNSEFSSPDCNANKVGYENEYFDVGYCVTGNGNGKQIEIILFFAWRIFKEINMKKINEIYIQSNKTKPFENKYNVFFCGFIAVDIVDIVVFG